MEEHESNPLPMAELIGSGFFDLEMDENGVIVYRVSEDAEQINPEFYAVCKDAMLQELLEFAKAGLIEYRFNDDLDLEYRFTEAGIEFMRARGFNPE